MHKSKYTVYRGGSLEDDKIITSNNLIIPEESSITPNITPNYKELSDMELMSRLMTGEDAENLQEESKRRTRKKEYQKYSEKLGDIYIAKWNKEGLSNTGTLKLLGDPEFKNIRKLVNGTEDLKTIQKKLQNLYKSLDKSIFEYNLKAYIKSCQESYGQIWEKTAGLGERDIKDILKTLTTSGGKINDVLKRFDNDEINFTEAKKLIGSLFNTLHESIMEEEEERKKSLKKEVVLMKEEMPTITTGKKKKSKAPAKATEEEVAATEEAYKRTEELSKKQEEEGNIRLKELRSLDEGKEAEEEEKQKKYEGSQHIKTFDKLFTEIFKHIKTSGGKGHLFEYIMTKTNIPSEVPISAKENKELNQSIRHILTVATGRTQTDIPVLSSNFLPPNCSNYIDGLPYDLLDQYKNFIELKYYNTYMFGYKVKNGRLYETASGVNIEVKSVQFQMSKFVRDNLDDFKIFYIREGPNNYKIHNVYIKKDNNNKTINKPTNKEYNKNLTVIMAFEKSFYYFNPLELLTDDIMGLASTSDTKAYKITSEVYIPNLSKLNFFINESLISIGDNELARNDTRIPFSYFKRI